MVILKKQKNVKPVIRCAEFAEMYNINRRRLNHLLFRDCIKPPPKKDKDGFLVFTGKEKIIIPADKPRSGRPKGTTVANGARPPIRKPCH